MDLSELLPAERQPTIMEAVCWECGERTMCAEYVVCCTGTMFHICPACEAKACGTAEPEETPPGTKMESPTGDVTES